MAVSSVLGASSTSGSSSSSTVLSNETLDALGRDEFLTLLVAELQYQDPLNPMDNTDYVTQLAQFSELQEIRNLSEATTQASLLSVASSTAAMIGRTVVAEVTDAETEETTTVTGEVAGVRLEDGVPTLTVNGADITLDQVVEIH